MRGRKRREVGANQDNEPGAGGEGFGDRMMHARSEIVAALRPQNERRRGCLIVNNGQHFVARLHGRVRHGHRQIERARDAEGVPHERVPQSAGAIVRECPCESRLARGRRRAREHDESARQVHKNTRRLGTSAGQAIGPPRCDRPGPSRGEWDALRYALSATG